MLRLLSACESKESHSEASLTSVKQQAERTAVPLNFSRSVTGARVVLLWPEQPSEPSDRLLPHLASER